MSISLVFLLGGLLTFAMRFSFIYLFGRFEIPDRVRQTLRFVPPAVLSAIILPQLLLPSGQLDVSLRNKRLIAGMVAIAAARLTKNTLLTILAGMAALIILQFLP
jgi:branched-subunit amino acid transport protein